jgi:hypothetical protein
MSRGLKPATFADLRMSGLKPLSFADLKMSGLKPGPISGAKATASSTAGFFDRLGTSASLRMAIPE